MAAGPSRRSGPLRTLLWAALVLVSAPLTDLIVTLWPGGPGPAAVEEAYREEVRLVKALASPQALEAVAKVRDAVHRALWGGSGLEALVHEAAAARVGRPGGPGAGLAAAAAPIWETLYWGILLRALRLGVLAACAPLLAAVILAAVADGLSAWWLRRAQAVRESGFIYHRAKLGLRLALAALWLVYLLPPAAMDPRWVLVPFLALYGLSLRLALTWFKKHL